MTSATIVICTRNRPQSLRRCLERLHELGHPHDVLVVDNASDSAETRQVAEAAGVRYVREPLVGVNRARNLGGREVTSDVVVYLDDDAVPSETWLPNVLKEFDDPRVMAAGGRIIPGEEGRPDTSEAALISGYDCGPRRLVVDRDASEWLECACFGGLGNGANMAFRRSAFDGGDVFDERIGYGTPVRGFGDHSGFFRVVSQGGRAVYAPDAIVFHRVEGTIDEQRAKRIRGVKAWSAWLLLLAVEYPQYRRLLFRYVRGAVFGARRDWRPPGPSLGVSRWRAMLAVLVGPLLYIRIRAQKAREAAL